MKTRATNTPNTAPAGGRVAYEFSDIIHRRRAIVFTVFLLVTLSTACVGVFAPDLLQLDAPTGALVGAAGLAIGMLGAMVADATDARIFGARHVRGTGGELVATVQRTPAAATATQLLAALDGIRRERIDPAAVLRVGIADASPATQHAEAWTSALAKHAALRGERVLEVALATGPTNTLGVADVVRDNVPLATATQRISSSGKHARLNAGPNRVQALSLLPELTATLPRNLDTYLVSLPLAASRPVVSAVAHLDVVVVIAEHARTTRVELIAGLDAIETAGVMTQVMLIDDRAGRASARDTPALHATDEDAGPDATVAEEQLAPTGQLDAPTPPLLPGVTDLPADPDRTDRIPQPPRVGRVHDDADHTLLRTTARFARYEHQSAADTTDDDTDH